MIAQDDMTLPSIEAFQQMLLEMVEPIERPEIQQPTWEAVVNVLRDMERGYFASSSGPDGSPWAPLKPYTVAKKGHAIILRETYELMNSLTQQGGTSIVNMQPTQLEFGTNRAWAWVHQDGQGKIPARPFIGMNDQGTKDVLDVVADAAVRMMFG